MDTFYGGVATLSDFLWGGNWGETRVLPVGLLTVFLLGSGLYMMIRLGARPLRRLGPALRETWQGRKADSAEGAITPWQALATALSGQVGTGNLAGVATAITLGGPGAVFWMWVTAIFGMALAFAETSLAVKFRRTDESGRIHGGPMYYIRHGMGRRWHWLAVVFCIGTVFSATATGGMIQSNSITGSMQQATADFASSLPCPLTVPAQTDLRIQTDAGDLLRASGCDLKRGDFSGRLVIVDAGDGSISPASGVPSLRLRPAIIGFLIASLVFAVIIGGIRSIGRFAGYLVPFMALFYVVVALGVLLANITEIPRALGLILASAFGLEQAAGGFAGGALAMAIRAGVARGLFSNEAGQGSSAIAHAASRTRSPMRQGEIAMVGVFVDTIVICTMTALVILCVPGDYVGAGGEPVRFAWQAADLKASAITISAFQSAFPGGEWVVVVTLLLFAFTTIVGWSYYAEQAIGYLSGNRGLVTFRYVWVIVIFLGSLQQVEFVWNLGDLANATMILPNLVAVLALSATVIAIHRANGDGDPAAAPPTNGSGPSPAGD